jgi:hypothetical protein
MTASAASSAARSTHADTSAPRPSCSRFHGRSGSIEWAVTAGPVEEPGEETAEGGVPLCEWTTSASVGRPPG